MHWGKNIVRLSHSRMLLTVLFVIIVTAAFVFWMDKLTSSHQAWVLNYLCLALIHCLLHLLCHSIIISVVLNITQTSHNITEIFLPVPWSLIKFQHCSGLLKLGIQVWVLLHPSRPKYGYKRHLCISGTVDFGPLAFYNNPSQGREIFILPTHPGREDYYCYQQACPKYDQWA